MGMCFGGSITDFVGHLFSVAGRSVSFSKDDGWSRDVLQKESAAGVTTGQLDWEVIHAAQAGYARTGSLHGRVI